MIAVVYYPIALNITQPDRLIDQDVACDLLADAQAAQKTLDGLLNDGFQIVATAQYAATERIEVAFFLHKPSRSELTAHDYEPALAIPADDDPPPHYDAVIPPPEFDTDAPTTAFRYHPKTGRASPNHNHLSAL